MAWKALGVKNSGAEAESARRLENLRHEQAEHLERYRQEHAIELERVRERVVQDRAQLDSLLQMHASGMSSLHEQTASAVQKLWTCTLSIRRLTSPFLFPYQLFSTSEYAGLSKEKVENMIPSTDEMVLAQQLEDCDRDAEDLRPFVGDRLWLLFYQHRALSMRMAVKAATGRRAGVLFDWRKDFLGNDESIDGWFTGVLTQAQIKPLVASMQFGVPQALVALLEQEILAEIHELLFGRHSIRRSLEDRQWITEGLEKLRRATRD